MTHAHHLCASVTPQHAFFDACERLSRARAGLVNAFEAELVLMRVRLIEYCNAELATRNERRGVQSYDEFVKTMAK